MAFQVKDALSIVAGMVNRMRAVSTKVTDYRIGSVARTLVEGVAVEIDELYQNMLRGLVEAIPVVLYQAFAFTRRPPAAAVGRVVFSIPAAVGNNIDIPPGTVISRADTGATYVTATAATILAGQTSSSTTVIAQVAGPAGNAPPNQLTVLTGGPGGLAVTNPAPIAGGSAEETDDERRVRFLEYVSSLSRGPVASIEYGARQVALYAPDGTLAERVLSAAVVERWRLGEAPGYVDLYVYNGGAGASIELLAAVRDAIDGTIGPNGEPIIGYKAAGIVVRYYAVTRLLIAPSLAIKATGGRLSTAAQAAITDAVSAYIEGVRIGAPVYRSEIIAAAMSVPGVEDAKVTTPTADVITLFGQKPAPDGVTLAIS